MSNISKFNTLLGLEIDTIMLKLFEKTIITDHDVTSSLNRWEIMTEIQMGDDESIGIDLNDDEGRRRWRGPSAGSEGI